MRIAIAAFACLIASPAFAQDLQQLENEHVAALQARDRFAADTNAAVTAKDWRLACIRAGQAVDENSKAADRLKKLREAVDGRIDPAIVANMSATVTSLLIQSSNMQEKRDGFCAEANKQ